MPVWDNDFVRIIQECCPYNCGTLSACYKNAVPNRQESSAITVNGREDTVIICHDDYIEQQKYISELETKLSVYNHLSQAADDLKLGRVQNVDDAFDDIMRELDDLKL